MSHHLPRKEGDREDFNQCPTAYDALTNGHPNLYAPRSLEEIVAVAKDTYPRTIAYCNRWIAHLENRIAYEGAMLDEQGGIKGEGFDYQPGGQVLRRGKWLIITKINKRDGAVNSVSVLGHFASTVSLDEIKDYRPPAEGDGDKIKAITAKGPMCNYPGEGFKHMTTAEWKSKKMSDVPQAAHYEATEAYGRHRTRATWGGNWRAVAVFLTDAKVVQPPPPIVEQKTAPFVQHDAPAREVRTYVPLPPTEADTMREQLKAGVQVVSAPQLFPTPPEIARQMCERAGPLCGHRVLEPSAGTGNLIRAIFNNATGADCVQVVAVEINQALATALQTQKQKTLYANDDNFTIHCGDFLEQTPEKLGLFSRVVLNPPFAPNAIDIKHIRHALTFLKSNGQLVALCANGPRQREQLMPEASEWIDLPVGSFKEAGTNVNVALVVFNN